MRVLVLGANGLLGSNVVAAARARGWHVAGTYHSDRPATEIPLTRLDITETDAVERVLSTVDPDWVVNCAAMTDLDGCEDDPDRAHAVNARAPGDVAALCASASRRFLHVSTDYVFDGGGEGRYVEDAAANPVQEYGASKLAGERAVEESDGKTLLARLSFVYGIHRHTAELTGFPAWVRARLRAGERTPLFTDQRVTPTRAGQAAETLCELVAAGSSGAFHVATRSCVTPYEFGVELCRRLEADEALLEESSQADVERTAERPSRTCLDVTRVEGELGRAQPTLAEDLDAIAEAFEPTVG